MARRIWAAPSSTVATRANSSQQHAGLVLELLHRAEQLEANAAGADEAKHQRRTQVLLHAVERERARCFLIVRGWYGVDIPRPRTENTDKDLAMTDPMPLGLPVRKVRFIGSKPVLRRAFGRTVGCAPALFSQSDTNEGRDRMRKRW